MCHQCYTEKADPEGARSNPKTAWQMIDDPLKKGLEQLQKLIFKDIPWSGGLSNVRAYDYDKLCTLQQTHDLPA